MKTYTFALLICMVIQSFNFAQAEVLTSDKGDSVPPVQYINRATGTLETEDVMGNGLMRFSYHTKFGRWVTKKLFAKRWPSKVMGFSKNTKRSAKKIPEFVEHYKINMNLFEAKDYATFNQFFARKFRDGERPFNLDPSIISAGSEARYLVLDNITLESVFPVKGTQIFLPELFGDAAIASEFVGGTIVIARLCPLDYHRFHFPVDATVLSTKTIHGNYDSVNPIALAAKPDILFKNERQIAMLENPLMGKFAMIEVGAFAVGKIIQSAYDSDAVFPLSFVKGQEKGYFQFGASTVIWVFKKGQVQLDADLLENSAKGMETLVELGDHLGSVSKH